MGIATASKISNPKGSFENTVFFNIFKILGINGIGNE